MAPLRAFWKKHPEAELSLGGWFKAVKHCNARNFSELRDTFSTADYVPDFTVFNVGGNKYRVVAVIHYNRQMIFIRGVFTHVEYDKWTKDNRGK
jgi:mRNA interferase HigB